MFSVLQDCLSISILFFFTTASFINILSLTSTSLSMEIPYFSIILYCLFNNMLLHYISIYSSFFSFYHVVYFTLFSSCLLWILRLYIVILTGPSFHEYFFTIYISLVCLSFTFHLIFFGAFLLLYLLSCSYFSLVYISPLFYFVSSEQSFTITHFSVFPLFMPRISVSKSITNQTSPFFSFSFLLCCFFNAFF